MYTVLEKGGVCSPKGFTASGICAGIKASGNADMALLKSEKAARCFAVFTTNKVKAAPVLYDKAALEHAHFASAVIVNSGNANACTGEKGYADAERMAVLTEEALKLTPKSVLVCSTGVIGHLMPMDKIEAGIPKLVEKLHEDASEEFGRAILTTDLALKSHAVEIKTEKGVVTIGGACKGSGMIHPNMATMLAFITTDLALPIDFFAEFRANIADSFNAITVDGDTGYTFVSVGINNRTSVYNGIPVIGSEEEMVETIYENVNMRKFTVYFYGGFDGWDLYRKERSNTDDFKLSNYRGNYDKASGKGFAFDRINNPESLGLNQNGLTSDWYAYLAGIRQFSNPEVTDINILATPGIDYVNQTLLVKEAIEMVEEERAGEAFRGLLHLGV